MGRKMSKTAGRLSRSEKTASVKTVPVSRSSADWLFSRRTARSPKAAGIRFISRRRTAAAAAKNGSVDGNGKRP
jgi:hypothetical protein